ncbi:MAG: dihydrofolate reductase, partial [Alphaproteobacteria bacterium]|nr:dihydrofolate reductase [Alphaproteobacteria bacterium]
GDRASVEAAIALAENRASAMGAVEIIVAGGGDIYRQTMALADRLEITHVHLDALGDAVFPAIDPARWQESARTHQPAGPKDDADCDFATYLPNPVEGRVSAH